MPLSLAVPGRPLPVAAEELTSAKDVARFLAGRYLARQPALLLRYGDTGGRVTARPEPGSTEYVYLQNFLGGAVTPDQVEWLAGRIEDSVTVADVVGLRSDLFGPSLPSDVLALPDAEVLPRLASLYPLRPSERTSLDPDAARRLCQTRLAMERIALGSGTLITDAWIHVALAEIGFASALLLESASVCVVTSVVRRNVVRSLEARMEGRLRAVECPAHPLEERRMGVDTGSWWDRWHAVLSELRPAYRGEPALISAGIWTKVIGPRWAEMGGIAIDFGSVIDFMGRVPSRPAVLATRYDDPGTVPFGLTLDGQLGKTVEMSEFLC